MEYTEEQIKVLIENKVIPKDAKPLQIAYFFEVCKRKKLDPFTKQIHMIERNERDGDNWKKSYTIQASIDGMRAIAQRNGTIQSIKRYVKLQNGILYGCCEIVTKSGGVYSDELSVNEYIQKKKDGSPTAFWAKMPETMIKKCAEESVLRMVSPEDLSGVYGDDEMLQADTEQTFLPKNEPVKQIAEAQDAVVIEPKKPEFFDDTEKRNSALQKIHGAKDIQTIEKIEKFAQKIYAEGIITEETFKEIGVEITKKLFELNPKGDK